MKITLNTPEDMVDFCNFLNEKENLGDTLVKLLKEVSLTQEEAKEFYAYVNNLVITKNTNINESTSLASRERKEWSSAEIGDLANIIQQGTLLEEAAEQLNRTPGGIRHKARTALGYLYHNNQWTR